jgi:hypothetical protein
MACGAGSLAASADCTDQYSPLWTALCPLIALALDAGDLASAIDYIRRLLNPNQPRLPNALTASFEQALLAWKHGAPERVTLLLQQATALAQLHYL